MSPVHISRSKRSSLSGNDWWKNQSRAQMVTEGQSAGVCLLVCAEKLDLHELIPSLCSVDSSCSSGTPSKRSDEIWLPVLEQRLFDGRPASRPTFVAPAEILSTYYSEILPFTLKQCNMFPSSTQRYNSTLCVTVNNPISVSADGQVNTPDQFSFFKEFPAAAL